MFDRTTRSKQSTPEAIDLLDNRLARLPVRLTTGDPDPNPDELQSAIAASQRKRRKHRDRTGIFEFSNAIDSELKTAIRTQHQGAATVVSASGINDTIEPPNLDSIETAV